MMNAPDAVPAAGEMMAPAQATRDHIAGDPSASRRRSQNPAKKGK
jgi:hypothetical protein